MEVHKKGTNLARRRRVPNLARRRGVPNLARRRKKGTQFGERVGHGGWLIGSKLFLPEACAVFELCEFIRTMKAYY